MLLQNLKQILKRINKIPLTSLEAVGEEKALRTAVSF
jgi:hypothetical protein